MKIRMQRIMVLFTAFICFLAMTFPTAAQSDAAGVETFVPKKLNAVSLGQSSYAELVNAAMIPTANSKLLTISIRFYNGGNSDLDLSNYWAKIRFKSKSGTAFSVKAVAEDRNKTKIPAKTDYTMTFYSELSADAKLGDVIVDIIQWDLYSSSSSFEKRLGEITFSDDHFTVPAGKKYEIKYTGMQLEGLIKKSNITSNEKYHNAAITLELYNNGKSTITLPQLKYYILTNEEILYALTPNRSVSMEIAPKMSEEISLRANIPVEVSRGNWKLVVAIAGAEGQPVLPLATYAVPTSVVEISDDFKAEYSFATLDGLYHVTINEITRSPIDDQDIIAARLTIANKGTRAVPVPELTGKFVLDDSIDAEGSIYQPNKIIAISPNGKIDVSLFAVIPYTFDFEELKLVLQEKDPVTNEATNLLEVSGKDVIDPLKLLGKEETYSLKNVGARSEYAIREVRTYTGSTSKRFTVQIDVKNLERRAIDIQRVAGYIKTNDGNIFPVEISEVKNKMTPAGKALLEISSYFPLDYDLTDATLILGEAVSLGGEAGGQLAYINPVEFELPDEKEPQTTLENIDLYPYRLSISNVKSQIQYGTGTLTLDFKYRLERDALVQFNGENKKLVIEVLDEKNNVSLSNEYAIEAGEESFLVGEHEFRFVNNEDPDLLYKIQRLDNDYKLNIYEKHGADYKKLLASKSIRWFSTSD